MKTNFITLIAFLFILPLNIMAQDKKEDGYRFTIQKELKTTSVKNQYRSGTCWSFATLSFLESELMRMGKGEHDLSEMFIVHQNYLDRGVDFVRYHAKKSFSAGAEATDVTNAIKKYGIVPQEAYQGDLYGEKQPVHGEMDAVLDAYLNAVIKNKNRKLSTAWKKGYANVLNSYLGNTPDTFMYQGKEYTPISFRDQLGLDMDNYVAIASYMHHPYYTEFIFEGPDNWSLGTVYNVPLNEMMDVINSALEQGYSMAWGSDVSEKGFAFRKGIAVVPETQAKNMADSEISKWENMSKSDKKSYGLDKPVKEKNITPELRQLAFDNYQSTEDHLMHMVGTAKDQNGTLYYLIKNSWGTDNNPYKGYFYASESFVKYKTLSVLVHKDALSAELRKKLDIK